MKNYIPLLLVLALSILTHYTNFNPWIACIGTLAVGVFLTLNKNWLQPINKLEKILTVVSVVLFLLVNAFFVFKLTVGITVSCFILGTIAFTWLFFGGFFRKKLGNSIEPEVTAWGIYVLTLLSNVLYYIALK